MARASSNDNYKLMQIDMSSLIRNGYLLTILGLSLFIVSCGKSDSHYMSEKQRQKMGTLYDSLQNNYKMLMDNYESSPDQMSPDLKSMYAQMQNMHQEMDVNHRQMMAGKMGRHMKGREMMSEGMGMQMQGHMTREWYQQMMSMHERMAALHEQQGQKQMGKMNRRLSERYNEMNQMIPDQDEQTEDIFNEEGDPSLLNGESLYSQNCASCHGSDAGGLGRAFPPLVHSEWVTEDKETPIRILLHGLEGDIVVQGQRYQGVMPSFKARMSAAEMAAILNYVRNQSRDDLPDITQDDVIRVSKSYSDRNRPWTASELQDESE